MKRVNDMHLVASTYHCHNIFPDRNRFAPRNGNFLTVLQKHCERKTFFVPFQTSYVFNSHLV